VTREEHVEALQTDRGDLRAGLSRLWTASDTATLYLGRLLPLAFTRCRQRNRSTDEIRHDMEEG